MDILLLIAGWVVLVVVFLLALRPRRHSRSDVLRTVNRYYRYYRR